MGAVVGQFANMTFGCDQNASNITMVIDSFIVVNGNAAGMQVNWGWQEGFFPGINVVAADRCFSGERPGTNSSPPLGNTPLGLVPGNLNLTILGRQEGSFLVAAGASILLPLQFTVQQSQVFCWETNATNQTLEVTVFGRFFTTQ